MDALVRGALDHLILPDGGLCNPVSVALLGFFQGTLKRKKPRGDGAFAW
jgi:hypothetical protein